MSFSNGETVGRYRIVDQLGQGGMATVYRAYDANLDRYVAIKVLHQAFKEDPNFLARFKREAQIVARLRHPHIVAVHGFDEHNSQPYLVMEFIEGDTLKGRLSRQPMPLDETVRIMTAVSNALTYAHDQGVLHRDIKPSNILVDHQGTPFLTDFGLARMVEAGESTLSQDMMLGTPQYISPEQAQGIRTLGPATDIYSLGIVLYQLVVGRVPFSADTPYAIIHDHIYKPLPIPTQINPDVPPAVEQVLMRALAKSPEERYQTASEMAADFRTAVESSDLSAFVPGRIRVPASALPSAITPDGLISSSPYPVIPAVTPAVSDALKRTASAVRRARRRRNLWMLSGLGTFIFICLVGILILIVAVTDPSLRGGSAPPPAEPPSSQNDLGQQPPVGEIPTGLSVDEARALAAENQDDPAAYFALGFAMLADAERALAQAAMARAIELAEGAPGIILVAAQTADELNYPAEAIALYLAAMNEDRSGGARNEAGRYLYEMASSARAADIAIFNRLTETFPNSPLLHAMHARALIAMRQLGQAEEALDRAFELDDSLPETHLIRGEWYATSGRVTEAEREWRYALTAVDSPAWVVEKTNSLLNPDEA